MYGALLRPSSKNAKTLEDSCTSGAVLKLWMAKTFEKITLFVKSAACLYFYMSVLQPAGGNRNT